MLLNEFYILSSLYNGSKGLVDCQTDIEKQKALQDAKCFSNLVKRGYIKDNKLTSKALNALQPYKVNNAVILAAGASTRFIPLSLEQPKGLYEVRNEKLIERQICQLKQAGINDITLVLGYKKEMFYYLKDKYQVKFIINDSFNIKNNIESLRLAQSIISNTYICVSDDYFMENPFNQFEYRCFFSGSSTSEKTDEMYAITDSNNRITRLEKGLDGGRILLGHCFFDKQFSQKFFEIVNSVTNNGKYDKAFWEWLVKDYLNSFDNIYFKEFSPNTIFEFDYFDDLRKFDTNYLGYSHSDIMRNIKLIFRCDEEDIINFRNVSKGLTNKSFVFEINGIEYIYRHPGDGTESIVNRKNEKKSLVLAKQFGIDPTYIYLDVNEGWKISQFIADFREPDYNSFNDSKLIIKTLRKLHNLPITVDYGLDPIKDSIEIEKLLKQKDPNCFKPYQQLKENILKLYSLTENDGIEKCFCHGDTYQPNWMILPDNSVILIDWEYSGVSDPGIDIGYYIVDGQYDFQQAEQFIKEYLQQDYNPTTRLHYLCYISIIAYYWFVWALYRESCGASMPDALHCWLNEAIIYSDYVLDNLDKIRQ
ncbi:MAG: phosphotransferase [Erysipelotrichaceae bacterium]|nr:phosphotransferase [Erysipelotrichaceae bacterium]